MGLVDRPPRVTAVVGHVSPATQAERAAILADETLTPDQRRQRLWALYRLVQAPTAMVTQVPRQDG